MSFLILKWGLGRDRRLMNCSRDHRITSDKFMTGGRGVIEDRGLDVGLEVRLRVHSKVPGERALVLEMECVIRVR